MHQGCRVNTNLLLDSDIFAFQVSATHQSTSPWGTWAYFEEACKELDTRVAHLMEDLKADEAIMCLTDPLDNWRYNIRDNYKDRDRSNRPVLLTDLKEYLANEYTCYQRDSLEADDVLGILSTHPSLVSGRRIIVSEDKDLRTVPGLLFNPRRPELGVLEISQQEAAAFHMWQTIVGDPTDGFGGARGVGKTSEYATDIIACDMPEMWDCVLDAFASVGADECEALENARMAKILDHHHYNFKTKEVLLWNPIALDY